MQDTIYCNICKNETHQFLFALPDVETNEIFSIYQCNHCRLESTSPRPHHLEKYYPNTYYGKRHGLTARYCVKRRIRWLNKISEGKKGKLLDIGCGDGAFLLQAKKEGWQVVGTEISSSAYSNNDFEIRKNLTDLFPLGPFDCITLWHSLEHMQDPKQTLAHVYELLTPQGLLLIAVPNAAGWQSRLFVSRWLHRDVPRHIFHFNPHSLCRLLQAEQFDLIKSWHQEFEYDLLGWSQSVLNYLFSEPNIFFKILTGRSSTSSMQIKIVNFFGGMVFSIISLPLLPLSALAKAGGTFIVAAKKR